mmetsp:Transcript_23768/g.22805  ORF Transcript_23768/g.22805 Transcript_23768/m.22805 type:complete len:95 (+) Transcript_23768:164-448(+)
MMRGRNPRRNALEYGVLISLATGMTCAYGVMIYVFSTPGQDGKARDLRKVDLNAPVSLGEMWRELTRGSGLSGILGATALTKDVNAIGTKRKSN